MKDLEIIEKLRNDEHYYGEFGAQFLSNSDIKTLLEDPRNFKNTETTLAMLYGRYFHTHLFEQDKIDDYVIVDASTRITKIYKESVELNGGEMVLLQKEADEARELGDLIKSNMELCDIIYAKGNKFEEPKVAEIYGKKFKMKADVETPEFIVDAKSTSDITKFRRSANIYGYDSQDFIYEKGFGKPLIFICACKKYKRIEMFTCSSEFKMRGEEKTLDAINQYDRFFGPNATDDVNNYYDKNEL